MDPRSPLSRLAASLAPDGTISNLHAFTDALRAYVGTSYTTPADAAAAFTRAGLKPALAEEISRSLHAWL